MEIIKRAIGQINYRSEGEKMPEEFGGIAAVVNSTTDLRFFEERIEPGAFENVLEDDVRVLFNHDADAILGRTKSNTAKVWVNGDGNLEYSWKPDYENPLHKQVARSIMRGDITQSSFAFTIEDYSWEKSDKYGDNSTHVIRKIKELMDVSPVTYPAYQDTISEARSILRTKPDSYTDYPEAASNNAQRALDWAEENGWGDCGTDVGKKRAAQLASKSPISRDVIAKMAAFKRHQQNKDVPYDEGCGGLMWDAWGGDAGIEWAARKLKEIDGDKQEKSNDHELINIVKTKYK